MKLMEWNDRFKLGHIRIDSDKALVAALNSNHVNPAGAR